MAVDLNIFGTEENMKTCRRGGFDSRNEILNYYFAVIVLNQNVRYI